MAKEKKEMVPMISENELTKVHRNVFNKDQMNVILAKTPAEHIFTRPAKGGGTWKYVTGVYVKKVLNMVFGFNWDFQIIEYKFDLNIKQAYVLGALTVKIEQTDGRFTEIKKMQFGRADIKFRTEWVDTGAGKKERVPTDDPLDIGNDLKAAATDALKKCASELGIASDIYGANEFKEIKIIGNEIEDKVKAINRLLETDGMRLTEEDRMNIERILEQKEEESYDRTIRFLNTRLPKAAPKQN